MPSFSAVLDRRLRMLPEPAKSALKSMSGLVDPLIVRSYRLRNRYADPIPPARLRARIGSGIRVDTFVGGGRQLAGELQGALVDQGTSIAQRRAIYDWGCGCGRLLISLRERTEGTTRLIGSDIDSEAVAWVTANVTGVEARVNRFSPPLPAGDDEVDLLVSSSILTHLAEPDQAPWLAEIARVVEPGGLAAVTICGPAMYASMKAGNVPTRSPELLDRLARLPDLDEAGFIFEPYERKPANERDFAGVAGEYGLAFHSHAYVRTHWAEYFDVLEIREAKVNHRQDIVVLRVR